MSILRNQSIEDTLFDEAFSQVDKVRRVQLEECLRRVESLAVYYDRTGLVGDDAITAKDFDISSGGGFSFY